MASKWSSDKLTHTPVLLKETIDYLNIKRDGVYLDGTVGLGGHAAAILSLLSENGALVGLDLDEEALTRCKESIGAASNCHLISGTFSEIPTILDTLKLSQIDGLLLDLGLSSLQLDTPERGFSYRFDGPLHMGFSMTSSITKSGDALRITSTAPDPLASVSTRQPSWPNKKRMASAIFPSARRIFFMRNTKSGGRPLEAHPRSLQFAVLVQSMQRLVAAIARLLVATERGVRRVLVVRIRPHAAGLDGAPLAAPESLTDRVGLVAASSRELCNEIVEFLRVEKY